MSANSSDSVQIGISYQSSNKGGVKNEYRKRFNMEYGHHMRADTLNPFDAPNKKRYAYNKILLFNLPF